MQGESLTLYVNEICQSCILRVSEMKFTPYNIKATGDKQIFECQSELVNSQFKLTLQVANLKWD